MLVNWKFKNCICHLDGYDKNTALLFPLNYQNKVSSCKDNDLGVLDLSKNSRNKYFCLNMVVFIYCDIQ